MSSIYYQPTKPMNEDQVRADKEGKCAVWKHLTEKFQNTIKIYDTDHKSKQCKVDFVCEFANGHINFIDVKHRMDATSSLWKTTFISAAKIQNMYHQTEKFPNSSAYVYVHYADDALYRFDVKKIYETYAPSVNRVRKSRLGLGDNVMKDELIYEIDIEKDGFFCGFYSVQDKDLMEYFDWNLDKK